MLSAWKMEFLNVAGSGGGYFVSLTSYGLCLWPGTSELALLHERLADDR